MLNRQHTASELIQIIYLGDVKSSSGLTLNFSSMVLSVVEVLMVQTPPSSVISQTGVETVAAFRSRKFTSSSCTGQTGLYNVVRPVFTFLLGLPD